MYSRELLMGIWRTIARIRKFEMRCVKLYRKGKIRGYLHSYVGEEAIAAGACAALAHDDYIVSTHRGHGHCIAKGAEIKYMMAEICGKKDGYCKGFGGSMHIADVTRGNLGANGIVGGGIPLGIGAGMSAKVRGSGQVTVIFFSDGASNNGVFAESLNLAAIWNLPVIFLLENNHYAVSTPIEQSSRSADLYKRAEGYMVSGEAVDGNDPLAVYAAVTRAADRCRRGQGPVLIEAKTYRFGGHHVNDAGAYMSREKLEHYQSRDPLKIARGYLREQETCSEEELDRIEAEIEAEIDAAVEFAEHSPEMTPEEFEHELKSYNLGA